MKRLIFIILVFLSLFSQAQNAMFLGDNQVKAVNVSISVADIVRVDSTHATYTIIFTLNKPYFTDINFTAIVRNYNGFSDFNINNGKILAWNILSDYGFQAIVSIAVKADPYDIEVEILTIDLPVLVIGDNPFLFTVPKPN
jgi:hypothetical protein